MAVEWDSVRLEDLVEIKHGFAFQGRYFKDSPPGDILLTPGNFKVGGGFKEDKLKYYSGPIPDGYTLDGGDLLVTMTDLSKRSDTLGYPALVPASSNPKYLHNQRLGKVLIRSGAPLSNRFLYYRLCGADYRHEVVASATGTTVKHTSPKRIGSFKFLLPPLSEQHAIAHILGTLDDKIELNRRMNETLEGIARALFKSWFVDFDPVRAKSEGRDTGLPADILDLFPDSFEESELGFIPRGWQVLTIEEVSERVGMGPFGSSIKVSTFVDTGVPVISGQHLKGLMLQDSSFNFVTYEHAEKLSNYNVYQGDVIFTHAGNIGQVAFIPEGAEFRRYVLSQRQFFMRCDTSQISPEFVTMYFHSDLGRNTLLANASQTGVPSISRPVTYLRSIRLLVPSKLVLSRFTSVVGSMLAAERLRHSETDSLAQIRDTLLPELISGEVRVPDAEKLLLESPL